MLHTQKYYQHSGTVGINGLFTTLILGLATAVIGGAIYAYSIHYIPIIYLNFLLTLGLGFAIGYAMGFAGKISKVRNTGFLTACGAIFGIIGVYISWVAWIYILVDNEYLIYAPSDIYSVMQLLASEGAWEIFGWSPTGWALYAIWIVEAGMIIGGAALFARGFLQTTPFCDRCQHWVETENTINPLSTVQDTASMTRQLEAGDMTSLKSLPKLTHHRSRYCSLRLLYCNSCQQNHFLTLNDVSVIADEDKEKVNIIPIVENLIINSETHETLSKHWQGSEESQAPEGLEAFQQPES